MPSSQSNNSATRLHSAFVKPSRLTKGDTVAVLSPSWGGPNSFPHVYELGVKVLETAFGLKVTEYPTTSADAGFLGSRGESDLFIDWWRRLDQDSSISRSRDHKVKSEDTYGIF